MVQVSFFEFLSEIKKLFEQKDASFEFGVSNILCKIPSSKIDKWVKIKKFDQETIDEEISYKIYIFSVTLWEILDRKIRTRRTLKKQFIDESYEKIIEIINKMFVDEKLEKQFLFERTVKNLVIKDVNWEILTKNYDSDTLTRIENMKTALLQFVIEDKSIDNPEEKKRISFNLEFDENKLDYLINELRTIKSRMIDET